MFLYLSNSDREVPAAFTVGMSSDPVSSPVGQKVMWQAVLVNVGGGFSFETSEFTCQEDGRYFFILSTISVGQEGDRVDLQLQRNGNVVVTTLAQTSYNNAHGSSSTSAIVQCAQGERIWVVCNSSPCLMRGTTSRLTNWSGFLIG